tara:strand:+ start:88 stop:1068 length:981 start_codon:yes stop_codon:yes gene_type:complete
MARNIIKIIIIILIFFTVRPLLSSSEGTIDVSEMDKPKIINSNLETNETDILNEDKAVEKTTIESSSQEQEQLELIKPILKEKLTEDIDDSIQYKIPFFIYLILTLSLLTAISGIWISFWLYKWRKAVILSSGEKNTIIVPEEFWKNQNAIRTAFLELSNNLTYLNNNLNEKIIILGEQYNNLTEDFLTLQKALDYRDEEIKKLKYGYDQTIIKKFLRRFVKTHQALKDFYNESPSIELEQTLVLLDDALEESGVEIFSPEINTLYSKTEGLAENPKRIISENEDDIGKIKKINEEGYRMKTSSGYEYIIPAKVTVAINSEKEEEK